MKKIKVDQFNPSDNEYTVTEIFFENGDNVKTGDIVLSLESSKADIDVESEFTGFFYTDHSVGDVVEINAIKNVFASGRFGDIPLIASTKSLSGHALGAAGVNVAIYSLIMMKNDFIAASANITDMDEEAKKYPIVTKVEKNVNLNAIMSNSFGFGGTNATLVFEKV